jgi:putative Mn2+ efflux pump MntP|tara:strand:+ start:352 stop:762 length:411 start_codon:yes stop_codon:yes gene_type:complete
MYEVSMQELSVFVVLGFTAGVFTSFYLTRLFEVVHMWRLLREVIAHLLLMCLGIIEDIEFLKELKKKQMHESGFTPEQMQKFQEVDDKTLTNWKDAVILSLVTKVPRNFRSMMPFNNWHEAMAFLRTELRALGGEE